jgi:hypothetical protein
MSHYSAGTQFYKRKGLFSVTVHLTKEFHDKLKKVARKDDRSIQKTARRILENGILESEKALLKK